MQTMKTLIRRRVFFSVASDLGLHFLKMSLLWDARLKWVKKFMDCYLKKIKQMSLLCYLVPYLPYILDKLPQSIWSGLILFATHPENGHIINLGPAEPGYVLPFQIGRASSVGFWRSGSALFVIKDVYMYQQPVQVIWLAENQTWVCCGSSIYSARQGLTSSKIDIQIIGRIW